MAMTEHYLAICAIFRNEAPYLAEWVAFHQLLGVEHFFLYDNNSNDDYAAVLQPFIEAGTVTVHQWPVPFHEKAQRKAYAHCLKSVRHSVRWLAFIDVDEFLFAPRDDTLAKALPDYESWPGVVVHWQNYGSSGRQLHSREPVIERFPWRARSNWVRNRKVKSIVDPSRTTAPLGVHHFEYADGARAVDETKREVRIKPRSRYKKRLKPWYGKLGPLLQYIDPYSAANVDSKVISVERLRINHYPVKSHQEFLGKTAYKKEKRRYEDVDYFAYHDRNEIYDPVIHRYLPALHQRLQSLVDIESRA
ncbi:MAG: hypothetical protein DRR04_12105 [Gammaproteobacteria bacterium]|nr:MAG: hypothetical protein DRR04_12105 [Gammaproteobacteria bacterium]